MTRRPRRPTLFPYTTLFRSIPAVHVKRRRRRFDGPKARENAIRVTRAARDDVRIARLEDHHLAFEMKLGTPLADVADDLVVADRQRTRLNSSHSQNSHAVYC